MLRLTGHHVSRGSAHGVYSGFSCCAHSPQSPHVALTLEAGDRTDTEVEETEAAASFLLPRWGATATVPAKSRWEAPRACDCAATSTCARSPSSEGLQAHSLTIDNSHWGTYLSHGSVVRMLYVHSTLPSGAFLPSVAPHHQSSSPYDVCLSMREKRRCGAVPTVVQASECHGVVVR
jgi:hypothetical protein